MQATHRLITTSRQKIERCKKRKRYIRATVRQREADRKRNKNE